MPTRLTIDFEPIARFVQARVPLALAQRMRAIGIERDGAIVTGALFEGYNGRNVWVHLAVDSGFNRAFIRACVRYVFVDLGCHRWSASVAESNAACRRFIEHFGFRRETSLAGAAADGGDVLIYVMTREECRHALEPT